MANPRERRFTRNRQAILDAALDIIREGGPAALNMRALADRTDYSAAGLYEYFGAKDEIIAALSEQGHTDLTAYMQRVDPSLPVVDYMWGIGLAYIRFAQENPDHFLLMFTSGPLAAPVAEECAPDAIMAEGSSFRILVDGIRRGVAEGEFVERPGYGWLEMAYAAWATVHGLSMLRITAMRGIPYDLDAAERQSLGNYMRGLQAA